MLACHTLTKRAMLFEGVVSYYSSLEGYCVTFLDELRSKLAAAQARNAAATARFQLAQAELQAAQQDVNVWNHAVVIESREEAARIAALESQPSQLTLESGDIDTEASLEEKALEEAAEAQREEVGEPVNKTEQVREILRRHPAGIDPATLWRTFNAQFPNTSRAYLYAVLKRLRDKEQVFQKKGKYMLKSKPLEEGHEN